MKEMQQMFQNAVEENVRNIRVYVTELKEQLAKLHYIKQLLVRQVLELEANGESVGCDEGEEGDEISQIENPENSPCNLFKEHMQQIIHLWDVCHVSIIHRTQFYLLFRGGDPGDQMYIEVEIKRLKWLQQHFSEAAQQGDDSAFSLSSSIKALRQERKFLANRLQSRLTED